jgi:hypothetical protein
LMLKPQSASSARKWYQALAIQKTPVELTVQNVHCQGW